MSYRYSQTDERNLRWMASDNSCATLNRVVLSDGKLRGLGKFDITFKYPIAAIAGENGSGKSTLLAIVACAFHNEKKGYKLSGRKNPYYTFSDFFIQSKSEIPPQGIRIRYQIRHNKWRKAKPGLGWQSRRKKEGGKWNNYDSRVRRNVIYFGIQRVVPHYERSTHRSYRGRFQPGNLDENVRKRIYKIASRIIGKTYSGYELYKHSKYSLPFTTCNGVRYSGFNMGAGESAVFEILTALFEAGRGALLVIDEIELGLHEKAQRRLIHELKELCKEFHCQIICSTHSHVILDELPPEARFFIESKTDESKIIPGISADWACGKLGGRNSGELDLFVEDETARAILRIGLPHAIRSRVNITFVGSSEAVLRQLTSRYLDNRNNSLAVLDGDKRNENESAKSKITKYAEASSAEEKEIAMEWAEQRITYIPGDTWPEKWLIETAQSIEDKTDLENRWGLEDGASITSAFDNALRAGKHNEFFQLAEEMQQPEEQIRADLINFIKQVQPNIFHGIIEKITEMLEENA